MTDNSDRYQRYGGVDESSAANAQPLKKISSERLKNILESHKKWLEGKKDQGKRANLSNKDLSGATFAYVDLTESNFDSANLSSANFMEAILKDSTLNYANLRNVYGSFANFQRSWLWNADLQGATFFEADFRGARLKTTNCRQTDFAGSSFEGEVEIKKSDKEGNEFVTLEFASADFTGADLREARLDDAILSKVTGLQSWQLAGASLSNAKLPSQFSQWTGLKYVEEISKHARGIFLAVIAACVFSWLTIATTTDPALLLNSATTPLPIIHTNVPIAGFYWFAPVILLALYFYLHFYLQSLWEGFACLPAVFPDGLTLDKRAYPWMLNSLVQAHFKLLRYRRPAFSQAKVFFSILAAWGLVPFTLFLFWGRYFPRQDWIGSGFHILLLTLSVFLALVFYARARATLRLEEQPEYSWISMLTDTGNLVRLARSLAVGSLAVLLFLGAYFGHPVHYGGPVWQRFVAEAGFFIGFDPFPNAVEADLSEKGSNWHGFGSTQEMEAQFEQVRGAKLANRRLRYADFSGAFLVKADLSLANLRLAFLRRADLRRANLYEADLRWATMIDTDLSGANLRGADLTGAFGLTRDQLARACVTDIRDQPKLPVNVAGTALRLCPSGQFLR